MFVISELINMWINGRSMSSRVSHFQDLMSGLAAIAFCVLFAMMLCGVLVLGICYTVYNALLTQGITPMSASLAIGSVLICLIALLVLLAWKEWLGTRHLPRQIIMGGSINNRVHHVVDAFMRGLTEKVSR